MAICHVPECDLELLQADLSDDERLSRWRWELIIGAIFPASIIVGAILALAFWDIRWAMLPVVTLIAMCLFVFAALIFYPLAEAITALWRGMSRRRKRIDVNPYSQTIKEQ